jgi:menaquinone-dependent protoporphyrinogen IX oxidase
MLLVHAIRREAKQPFTSFPIQSDYASRYKNDTSSNAGLAKTLANKILQYLPAACRAYVIGKYQLMRYSFSNREFYKRWRPF